MISLSSSNAPRARTKRVRRVGREKARRRERRLSRLSRQRKRKKVGKKQKADTSKSSKDQNQETETPGKKKAKVDLVEKPSSLSPSKRKIEILRKAKSNKANSEHDAVESSPTKVPARKGRKGTKGTAKAKSKAKASKEEVQAVEKNKPKAKAKAKAKATAKAKNHDKPAKTKKVKQTNKEQGECLDDEGLVTLFTDFALSFDIVEKATGDKFKKELRAHLPQFDHMALNIYWTRSSCGVRSPSEGKDIAHFSFSSCTCEDIYKTAVSVKCGELLATRILTFWILETIVQVNYTETSKIYISISVGPSFQEVTYCLNCVYRFLPVYVCMFILFIYSCYIYIINIVVMYLAAW